MAPLNAAQYSHGALMSCGAKLQNHVPITEIMAAGKRCGSNASVACTSRAKQFGRIGGTALEHGLRRIAFNMRRGLGNDAAPDATIPPASMRFFVQLVCLDSDTLRILVFAART